MDLIRRLATGALSESGVFRLALPLLVALALPGLPVWAEVILFDNLAAGSPNGSFGVTNTQWTAQSFATTTAGFILDEVSIRLWNQNGTSGNFEIQVMGCARYRRSPRGAGRCGCLHGLGPESRQ